MSILDLFRKKDNTIPLNGGNFDAIYSAYNGELITNAFNICMDYIAAGMAQCEIRTFVKNKEVRGAEWYRWNVKPNVNQSSTEFWSKYVHKLYRNREALILPVNDGLYVADSFTTTRFAFKPYQFTNIVIDNFSLDSMWTSQNAIYVSAENDTSVSGISATLGNILDETLKDSFTNYHTSGGEKGLLHYEARHVANPTERAKYENLVNNEFANYFKSKNYILPLRDGYSYERYKDNSTNNTSKSFVTDMTSVIEEAYTRTAQAVRVPPALIFGKTTEVENILDDFITFCIEPNMYRVVESANGVLYDKCVLEGSYLKAETENIRHVSMFKIGEAVDKLHSNSILNINEIRRKMGEPEISEAWANEYVLTKNYETIEPKGGKST